MNAEDAKSIKCDRCNAVVGLHRHNQGWRCPLCIWNERANLIQRSIDLLTEIDYASEKHCSLGMGVNDHRQMIVVSRKNMDALARVVKEITT